MIDKKVAKHKTNNFGELFWKAVSLSPDKETVVQGSNSLTFKQLDQQASKVANLVETAVYIVLRAAKTDPMAIIIATT